MAKRERETVPFFFILEEKLGKPANRLGMEAGLGNKTVDKWKKQDPLTFKTNSVNTFLDFYNINLEWWETGEGEVFTIKPDAAVKIELYERLISHLEESKDEAWRQSAKWEQEATKLLNLLEMTLKSKLPTP